MKKWRIATLLFFAGYLIATVLGFALFYVSKILMWIGMFTIMPVVFTFLIYWYLCKIDSPSQRTLNETLKVIITWIALSFTLDAIVYILIVPLAFGRPSNWHFFIDQSPWIWFNYLAFVLIGFFGRLFYHHRLRMKKARASARPG